MFSWVQGIPSQAYELGDKVEKVMFNCAAYHASYPKHTIHISCGSYYVTRI